MFEQGQKATLIAGFLFHLLIAIFGALSITGLLAFLLEQMIPRKLVSLIALGPTFLLPIATGVVLGYCFVPRFSGRGAKWVWIIPALLLIVNVLGSLSSPYERSQVWINEFGPQSLCTACLDETLITAPFFCCLGYSLGASIRARRTWPLDH